MGDGRTYYRYETVAGDVFSVVRPGIGPEAEREVREWLVRLVSVRYVGGHAAPYDPAQGGLAPLTPNVVELGRERERMRAAGWLEWRGSGRRQML